MSKKGPSEKTPHKDMGVQDSRMWYLGAFRAACSHPPSSLHLGWSTNHVRGHNFALRTSFPKILDDSDTWERTASRAS